MKFITKCYRFHLKLSSRQRDLFTKGSLYRAQVKMLNRFPSLDVVKLLFALKGLKVLALIVRW